ncbi:MAG: type III pantothenate kinase [Pseudomonadota bacterium]
MNLLFDIGNTRIKAATLDGGRLTSLSAANTNPAEALPNDWTLECKPASVWISSVAGAEVTERIAAWVDKTWRVDVQQIEVLQDRGGVHTQYSDPTQLGVDRWLAAIGGYHLAGKHGACVIDAGTALTVDVVDEQGIHRGGLIAPGLGLMIESLTKQTAQLALENISVPDIFATNTEAAISLGCADYIAGMIDRVNQRILEQDLAISHWYSTGGQGEMVMALSNLTFELVPDLVLRGMAIVVDELS